MSKRLNELKSIQYISTELSPNNEFRTKTADGYWNESQ